MLKISFLIEKNHQKAKREIILVKKIKAERSNPQMYKLLTVGSKKTKIAEIPTKLRPANTVKSF